MNSAVIASPLGNLLVNEEDGCIKDITFTADPLTAQVVSSLRVVTEQIDEYFQGQRREFDFNLAPEGTPFQQKVWQELQKIPFGETISYQELATRLGDPKVIRAAATANGKNPIVIAIPCHRVIGSDGSLTGYAGGLERKKTLLRLEGVDIFSQIDLFNEI